MFRLSMRGSNSFNFLDMFVWVYRNFNNQLIRQMFRGRAPAIQIVIKRSWKLIPFFEMIYSIHFSNCTTKLTEWKTIRICNRTEHVCQVSMIFKIFAREHRRFSSFSLVGKHEKFFQCYSSFWFYFGFDHNLIQVL